MDSTWSVCPNCLTRSMHAVAHIIHITYSFEYCSVQGVSWRSARIFTANHREYFLSTIEHDTDLLRVYAGITRSLQSQRDYFGKDRRA
jgi:hypothetical protein